MNLRMCSCSPHWKNPDSDKMELSYLPGKAHLSKNAVIQDGNLHQPSDYVSEIIDGFTRTYGFLTGIKEDLLALDSPIMAFKNKEIRVVLRNTNLYVRMLYRLCNSHFLRDGSAWSIDLDVLSQAFTKRSCTTAAEAPHYWEIFTDERAAMNVNDVPFFTANSSATSLFLSGGRKVRDFYVEPSFAGMVKRLEELDERDMARQVDFIKGSLFSRRRIHLENSDGYKPDRCGGPARARRQIPARRESGSRNLPGNRREPPGKGNSFPGRRSGLDLSILYPGRRPLPIRCYQPRSIRWKPGFGPFPGDVRGGCRAVRNPRSWPAGHFARLGR